MAQKYRRRDGSTSPAGGRFPQRVRLHHCARSAGDAYRIFHVRNRCSADGGGAPGPRERLRLASLLEGTRDSVGLNYDRNVPSIVLTTEVAAPPSECFALSLSVDAHTASMQRSGERAVGGTTTGGLGLGDAVTWRARHFGLPFRMTSRITAYDEPRRFVDEQTSGPFRSWWHEHEFTATPNGTLMRDTVRYTSPAGPLGRVVDRLLLTGYLTRLLATRNRWIATELSGAPEA